MAALVFAVAPVPAQAAIAVDATGGANCPAGICGSTLSWTHTYGSIADGYIAVMFGWNTTNTVTSVACGSASLSLVVSESTSNQKIAIYGAAVGTISGAVTCTVTLNGTPTAGRADAGASISFSGVDQASPIDATQTAHNVTGTNISTSITTNTDGAYLIDIVGVSTGQADSPGGSQTSVMGQKQCGNSGSFDCFASRSTSAISPAGSFNMQWTLPGNSQTRSHAIAALKPSSGGGGGGSSPVPDPGTVVIFE
jgi:hypothetical protein